MVVVTKKVEDMGRKRQPKTTVVRLGEDALRLARIASSIKNETVLGYVSRVIESNALADIQANMGEFAPSSNGDGISKSQKGKA